MDVVFAYADRMVVLARGRLIAEGQAEAIRKLADAYNRTRLTPVVKSLFTAWLRWRRRPCETVQGRDL